MLPNRNSTHSLLTQISQKRRRLNTGDDRFIVPSVDVEQSHYLLVTEQPEEAEYSRYQHELAIAMFGMTPNAFRAQRILSPSTTPRSLRLLDESPTTLPSYISPVYKFPTTFQEHRILDAPNVANDFYSQPLSWNTADNVLFVTLQNNVYCWNPNTSNIGQLQTGDNTQHRRVVCSSNVSGKCITGTLDGYIEFYRTESLNLIRRYATKPHQIAALIEIQPHFHVAGTRQFELYSVDDRTRAAMPVSTMPSSICGLAYNQDTLLATGEDNGTVRLWDIRSFDHPISSHKHHDHAGVKAISFSPHDNTLIATGGGMNNSTVCIWNSRTDQQYASIATTPPTGFTPQITSIHWSTASRYEFIVTTGNSVQVWHDTKHAHQFKNIAEANTHENRVITSTLEPSGGAITTIGADETIRFFSLQHPDRFKRRIVRVGQQPFNTSSYRSTIR